MFESIWNKTIHFDGIFEFYADIILCQYYNFITSPLLFWHPSRQRKIRSVLTRGLWSNLKRTSLTVGNINVPFSKLTTDSFFVHFFIQKGIKYQCNPRSEEYILCLGCLWLQQIDFIFSSGQSMSRVIFFHVLFSPFLVNESSCCKSVTLPRRFGQH